MDICIETSLENIRPEEWDALGGDADPFLAHAFLVGLERHGCVGETFGWYPHHLLIRDEAKRLIGAMPMYLKTNSYGELVFDWSWASAYERAGRRYYPKLVVGIPYTPITGRRLLCAADVDTVTVKNALIQSAIKLAADNGLSSIHWLFLNAEDRAHLKDNGMLLRRDCQYHWHNRGYADFEAFVGDFSSRKRKKVNRERRRVEEQGIELKTLHGDEIDADGWAMFHRFYVDTFEKNAGIPTLTLPFFEEIGARLADRIVMVVAEHDGRPVAAALNFRNDEALFGRYWGCDRDFHSLHFEACYYQGIDYCIEHGLDRFEPGAQGEHKIARGFLPTTTWSAHWIGDEEFRAVIDTFCRRERHFMAQRCQELMSWSPFREGIDVQPTIDADDN
jgi:predicted N-acyltransferase